jgi:hypothetical protein
MNPLRRKLETLELGFRVVSALQAENGSPHPATREQVIRALRRPTLRQKGR